ncbi:uncharacterized protein N7529_005540 [Penicillium soppii]|jgi:hypothetical protein|uniref:uncharacterized protein n=1 Tax=Penicillium soppii TaxID=69789 RepID=UPI00254823DF|nr:uncharacterized protein N7529_005540 [Penicillium soppii]KAJ5863624.1 hypothetical protein N7529_005540 [Penicillium soppii]
MNACDRTNSRETIELSLLRPPNKKSRIQASERYLDSSEKPKIPVLRDENGRDLLSDESETGDSISVNKQWSSDTLRRLDHYSYDSASVLLSSPIRNWSAFIRKIQPNKSSMSRGKWNLTSKTELIEYEEIRRGLSPGFPSRFYGPKLAKEKLLGPENYKDWAATMEKKLRQCGEIWGLESDIVLALVYGDFNRQWPHINSNVWMMIFSNVSESLRNHLSALGTMDARKAWQFLEKRCGGNVPLIVRSVDGVRDIMSIRYEECKSLREYLDKMLLCARAIECKPCGEKERSRYCRHCGGKDGHGGKRCHGGNEWLWCQFILVNLGPEWQPWVSALAEKCKIGEQMVGAISSFKRLFPIIEAEDARRIQASRYTKRREE